MKTPEQKLKEWYAEDLGRRVSEGMRVKAERGEPTSRIPLGYMVVVIDGKKTVAPDPETAPLVRECFALLARRNTSMRKVLAEIAAKGLRNRKGKPLTFSTFQGMIANPFYIGTIRFDGKEHPGSHEAIISSCIFHQVHGHLRERQKSNAGIS